MWNRTLIAGIVGCLGLLAPTPARAAFLTNGGFEAGLTGWTVVNQGSGSFFPQTGAASPANGFPVQAPPEGNNAAITDQSGPGAHVLYQDFVVPVGVTSATLTFQRYIRNDAGEFTIGEQGLDSTGGANQQARVDILLGSAGDFSVSASDVLVNAFQTVPGDSVTSGYSTVSVDLTAVFAAQGGQTLRLRFAEVDNQLYFNFGVDAVDLVVLAEGVNAVPVPPTLMLAAGIPLLAGLVRRRRRASDAA